MAPKGLLTLLLLANSRPVRKDIKTVSKIVVVVVVEAEVEDCQVKVLAGAEILVAVVGTAGAEEVVVAATVVGPDNLSSSRVDDLTSKDVDTSAGLKTIIAGLRLMAGRIVRIPIHESIRIETRIVVRK